MKAYVRAPYNDACLEELRTMFDEVVYEPWTATGERYYEDEYITVEPETDKLVFAYYPAWSENRNRANNCQ